MSRGRDFGDGQKLLDFACGHATFELLGMIFAGVAGLRLGLALLKPGRLSRRDALRVAGGPAVRILLGAAFLTLIAAVIDASLPSATPSTWKFHAIRIAPVMGANDATATDRTPGKALISSSTRMKSS